MPWLLGLRRSWLKQFTTPSLPILCQTSNALVICHSPAERTLLEVKTSLLSVLQMHTQAKDRLHTKQPSEYLCNWLEGHLLKDSPSNQCKVTSPGLFSNLYAISPTASIVNIWVIYLLWYGDWTLGKCSTPELYLP